MPFTYVSGDPSSITSTSVLQAQAAFDFASNQAATSMAAASTLATSLANFASPPPISYGFGLNSTPTASAPTPTPTLTVPEFPTQAIPTNLGFQETLGTASIDIPEAPILPEFDESADLTIELPEKPLLPLLAIPVKPVLSSAPTVSDLILTDIESPELIPIKTDYNLPDIIYPEFDAIAPLEFDLDVDTTPFTYEEEAYTDELLEKVIAVLLGRLDGGTGLNSTVEQAIWDRGKDREASTAIIAERTLLVERTAQGFSRPTGSILSALTAITQNLQSKLIELSRDVMIKQADLEQLNLREAIQQTMVLEATLIDQSLKISQRLFEAAKYTREFFLEVFKVEMSKYQMQVEIYKTYVQIYSSKLQAEQLKLQVFSDQLKAEDLKLGLNKSLVDIYQSQIQANKIQAEIYQIMVSAVSDKIKNEALKIDSYRSEVEAFSAMRSAQNMEMQTYIEEMKAEISKVSVTEAKARVFGAKVEAYAAANKANADLVAQQVSMQEFALKSFLAKAETYTTDAKIQQANYDAVLSAYKSQNETFANQVNLEKLIADIKISDKAQQLQEAKNTADVALANAKLASEEATARYAAQIEAIKGAGSTMSTLANAAMGSLHASSSIGATTQYQGNESHNFEE